MVDASAFNLNPQFPIAGVADILARKNYQEALINEARQKQLVEGFQGLGTGINSIIQRKIAIAQALASGRILQNLQSQSTATPETTPAALPPVPSTGTVTTSNVSRETMPPPGGPQAPVAPMGLPQGGIPAASMPPQQVPPSLPPAAVPPTAPATPVTSAPNPTLGTQQDWAAATYGRDPNELIKTMLESMRYAKERTVQTRGQDVEVYKAQMEKLRADNKDAIELQKANIQKAVDEHRISVEEANSLRTTLSNLEQKQTALIKEVPGFGTTVATLGLNRVVGAGAFATEELKKVGNQIKQIQDRLDMTDVNAGLPAVGKTVTHSSGATITRTK